MDTYAVGDILYGDFPANDGRDRAKHYAVVYAPVPRVPLVRCIIGTSKHVPPRDGRDRSGLLVIWGADDKEHWPDTGLVVPTLFEFKRTSRVEVLQPESGLLSRYNETKAGTLSDSLFWMERLDRLAHNMRY